MLSLSMIISLSKHSWEVMQKPHLTQKLPLILMHKELYSSPPPDSLKWFQFRTLYVFYFIHKWLIPEDQNNKLYIGLQMCFRKYCVI